MRQLGWDRLDVILITGDSYIDSPFIGVAVIGKVLVNAGFRVGIIAQPDTETDQDIRRLGEPALFWGVTGGCVDSMVANWTATGKKRQKDDYTPGGINNRRPDRAVIVYANLIRKYFKNTAPIVLGGIEASLRRMAHYDFWSNKIRRSVLFDAKADYLAYGMAENTVLELARCIETGSDPAGIRGLCRISATLAPGCRELPSYKDCAADKASFEKMFHAFYRNNDPVTAVPLAQKQDTRYLIQNPPPYCLSQKELDAVYAIDYERALHPFYAIHGTVRALDTIAFSITTHRGCYGECNFCAIAVHQGRQVSWRSRAAILAEAREISAHPQFKGIISDVGGPTANMYAIECARKKTRGPCPDKRCLFPLPCKTLSIDHSPQISLLRDLRRLPGIRKVVIASGIRHDMVLADRENGMQYLEEVVRYHVSGQLKLAPEHSETHVLEQMGKPAAQTVLEFKRLFDRLTKKHGLNQFLTYYLIAAHPGCTEKDMAALRTFSLKKLALLPEQVQVFTPTPSTWSALMYWTEKDPFTGRPCFVEKTVRGKERQKHMFSSGKDKKVKKQHPFENKKKKQKGKKC